MVEILELGKRLSCLHNFSLKVEIVAECTRDNDCPPQQACRSEKCVNPCAIDSPCGELAICSAMDHKAKCTCQAGFEGDPYRRCKKSKFHPTLLSFRLSCF